MAVSLLELRLGILGTRILYFWAGDILGWRHLGQRCFGQSDILAKDVLTKFTIKVTFRPKTFQPICFQLYSLLFNFHRKSIKNCFFEMFWPKRHFYCKLGQNIFGQNVSLTQMWSFSKFPVTKHWYSNQSMYSHLCTDYFDM